MPTPDTAPAMRWDEVVDVVCVGSGAGGLATAIVAADAGQEVFVADGDEKLHDGPPPSLAWPRPDGLHRRLGIDVSDEETNCLLEALTEDLGPLSCWLRDIDVPIRIMADLPPVESLHPHRAAETFIGARLRKWAVRCLASPYGVLYSQVSERGMLPMRSRVGESIEAAVIGSFDTGSDLPGPPLAGWLLAQAQDRGIDVLSASPLERLVFEDGHIVGAVVASPTGTCAVRARRGVVVATGGYHVNPTWPSFSFDGPATVQVCMVSKTASRFGRVELLTTEPHTGRLSRPSSSAQSDALRRRKVHG